MSIIQFPDSRENLIRINNEDPIQNLNLQDILLTTSDNVRKLIEQNQSHPNKIIPINTKEFKELILDYIVFHLNKCKIVMEGSIVLGMQYISELIFKFFILKDNEIKLIIDNPYFIYWISQGFPKRAGDASVYSYLFRGFDNNILNKEAYINFSISAYSEYSKDSSFGDAVGIILPNISDIIRDPDFLKRSHLKEV